MRKFTMAFAAAAMTLPTVTTLPVVGTSVAEARHGGYHGRTWRGRDGRTYCKRRNGTTGLLVGGAAGALIGRSIDTRGSRATGTILGAAAGAIVGREIDRNRKGGYTCR
jgi:Glycine zipper 2TM domain